MNALMDDLRSIVAELYSQQDGCPWVKEQSWHSIARYSLEEVYELWDAIEREDFDAVRDELADLCLHLVMYSELATQEERFTWDDIVRSAIIKQQKRRVSGLDQRMTSEEAHQAWYASKNQDRQHESVLADIPNDLPPLLSADQLAGLAERWGLCNTLNKEQVSHSLVEAAQSLSQFSQDGDSLQFNTCLGELLSTRCCAGKVAKLVLIAGAM